MFGLKADELTDLLRKSSAGDPVAAAALVASLYTQIHALAQAHMQGERINHTLGPTALVNELILKFHASPPRAEDLRHFREIASQAMANILIDHARTRGRAKRSGGRKAVDLASLDLAAIAASADEAEILSLRDAIRRLEEEAPESAAVVQCKFYSSLTDEQTAKTLGMSESTAKRRLDMALVFLRRYLAAGEPGA